MIVYIDGGVRPTNPGEHGYWAWVAQSVGREVAYDSGRVLLPGPITNNVAEYYALIKALEWLDSIQATGALVRSDSTLVVKQMCGEWAVKEPSLQPFAEQAIRLIARTRARLQWVPRKSNKRADQLVGEAYVYA